MIVMKFGGTSVEDVKAIRRLVNTVRSQLDRRPVVIVSAMGKTTNGLLECGLMAAANERGRALEKLESIAGHHLKTAGELASSVEKDELRHSITQRIERVKRLLAEIARTGKLTPRNSDSLSATGELLSSMIVAAALRSEDLPGKWVDIRPWMRTDDDFTRATVLFDQTDQALRDGLTGLLAGGGIPVSQGFIGSTAEGETTTIGRGGSDYSAAIIGAALDAGEIQIWTDVDGILTTDPRIVPEAAKVDTISFAEAAELAYFGARVLHPSTLLPAMAKDIPVRVCNSRRPHLEGTSIVRHAPPSSTLVRAIAFKRGITIVNVASTRMLMAYGFLARIFELFARHETSIDMISTSEVSVSMTLDDTRRLDRILEELQEFGEVNVERDQALVCLVGEKLKYTPGIAARIFSSIDDINVSMISHGASAINVSFIVADRDVERAVRALHREFFTEHENSATNEHGFSRIADRSKTTSGSLNK